MTSPGGARKAPPRRVGLRGSPTRPAAGGARAARRPPPRWSASGSSERARRGVRRASPVGRVLGLGLALVCLCLPGLVDPPPDSPTGLKVTARDAVVTATWTGHQADSYRVEYAEDPGFADATTEMVDDTSLRLTALTPGSRYYVRVSTVRPDGADSSPSPSVAFDTTYPNDAPTVKVSSNSSKTLKASWSEAGDDARYETQLSTTTDFTDVKELSTVKTRKTFSRLKPATLYAVRTRVVDAEGVAQSPWSEPAMLTTAAYEPLGVGTYNILKWRAGNWSARRTAVAELIKSSSVDVVGLQEATPSRVGGNGVPQYQDVLGALGGDWALTRSSKNVSGETRTVYDSSQVKLIREGYQPLSGSARFRGVQRYATYAEFEQRSTGKRFLFFNTHFTPNGGGSGAAQRVSEARQLADVVRSVNTDDLPVVVVGDFNAGGSRSSSNPVYRAIVDAGLIDPLVRSGELGEAEKRVDADLATVNRLRRTPPRRASPRFIDHIFVSRMRVSQWQVAANLDSAGRFIGTIPSDHHLVRATVYLP